MGEYIGSGHKAEHNIYIWDKNIGNLVKILEGPKEPLDDLSVLLFFVLAISDRQLTLLFLISGIPSVP